MDADSHILMSVLFFQCYYQSLLLYSCHLGLELLYSLLFKFLILSFFVSSQEYGLCLVIQSYSNNFYYHELIQVFSFSCLLRPVLPIFYHLNWIIVQIFFYYLVSLSVMFHFQKQTLIYPMKVQIFFNYIVSLFFLLQFSKQTSVYPLKCTRVTFKVPSHWRGPRARRRRKQKKEIQGFSQGTYRITVRRSVRWTLWLHSFAA